MGTITVAAKPETVSFDVQRSALIVVDMQNALATKGGYLDRAGFDISGARATVEKCRRVIGVARAHSIPIVYLQMGWHAHLHDSR